MQGVCGAVVRSAFLTFVLLIYFATPAMAVNFIDVFVNTDVAVFVDADSLEDRGDYYVVWSKYVPKIGTAKRTLEELKASPNCLMVLFAFDKKSRRFQCLLSLSYDLKGKILEQQSYPFSDLNYEEIIPGTPMGKLRDFAVNPKMGQPNATERAGKMAWKITGGAFTRNILLIGFAVILRFLIFRRRISVPAAIGCSAVALVGTAALFNPTAAGAVTASWYFILRIKDKEAPPAINEPFVPIAVQEETKKEPANANVVKRDKPATPSFSPPAPPPQEEHHDLLTELVLYIIAHSDQKHFSYSKLENYIVLTDKARLLGLTEWRDGEIRVVGLRETLNRLVEDGIIAADRMKTKSGGFRSTYKLRKKRAAWHLEHELKELVNDLIAEWDKRRSRSMLKVNLDDGIEEDEDIASI